MSRTQTSVSASAAHAARAALALKEAADRIDPYIPLTAYPGPVFRLLESSGYLSDCLYYAAPAAAHALALEPAAWEAGEPLLARRWLTEASKRAGRTSDTIQRAWRTLLRDLDSAGSGPGPEPADAELLTRRASQLKDCLAILLTDFIQAGKTLPVKAAPGLEDAAGAVMRLSLAGTFTGQACERFAYGLAEAYDRHPAGRRRATRPRPPIQLGTAASMMRHTAADTRRAYRTLDSAADRARETARRANGVTA